MEEQLLANALSVYGSRCQSVSQLNWINRSAIPSWPIHYLISAWISKNFILQILNINTLEAHTHVHTPTHPHSPHSFGQCTHRDSWKFNNNENCKRQWEIQLAWALPNTCQQASQSARWGVCVCLFGCAGVCVASWHNLICSLAHPFKSTSIQSVIHCAHCIKCIKNTQHKQNALKKQTKNKLK